MICVVSVIMVCMIAQSLLAQSHQFWCIRIQCHSKPTIEMLFLWIVYKCSKTMQIPMQYVTVYQELYYSYRTIVIIFFIKYLLKTQDEIKWWWNHADEMLRSLMIPFMIITQPLSLSATVYIYQCALFQWHLIGSDIDWHVSPCLISPHCPSPHLHPIPFHPIPFFPFPSLCDTHTHSPFIGRR